MKRIEQLYRTAVLPTLLMLAAACTPGDAFDDAFDDATGNASGPDAAITITVTDGGYAPDDASATRAVEKGFATEFTAGDAIGIYVVNEGSGKDEFVAENLKFTYNGLTWEADKNQTLPSIPHNNKPLYFAYYPYQDDMSSTNRKPDSSKDNAEDFFQNLINRWGVKDDQSTYAKYTANDLMVAQGVVAPRADGAPGSTLSFKMEHQMALLVIRMPRTTCTYTETISNEEKTKSYDLYTGGYMKDWWKENHYTARRIMKTDMVWNLKEFYYDSGFKKHEFTKSVSNNVSGTYKLYTVDDDAETKSDRKLREGDFYMKDGTVLSQEAFGGGNLPNDVKKDCIGVVFWVGEIARIHWTQTGYKNGDHLLMRDHPECVHGMVVAMHDASQGAVFATGKGATESTYDWADSFSGFTPGEQADWEEIRNSNSTFGYSKPRLLTLYGTRHGDTTFPVLDAIAAYAAAYPVPASSSGWFLPGRNEFATLFFGAPQDFSMPEDPYYYQNLLMLKVINPQIRMASGDALKGGYWSSTEYEDNAWRIDVSSHYGIEPKNKTYKVRAVLAF